MEINGTLMNYYFHCKRQCYLHGNRLNLEDNSEIVQIGKAMHEERARNNNKSEVIIDHIKLDRLTAKYVTEVKKSDADIDAGTWQLLYYLKVLKDKGIIRKGRLEVIEKTKTDKKIIEVDLTNEKEKLLEQYIEEIQILIKSEKPPAILNEPKCKKCAYFEYCYI